MGFPVSGLVILAAAIVYLVYMFKRGWYWQTVVGIAIAGGLVAVVLGIRRITDRVGDDWVGAVLLLGGLAILLISAVTIRKMSRRSSNPDTQEPRP